MYPPQNAFGKAYQDELLRASERLHDKQPHSPLANPGARISAWDILMVQIGDGLISLGERFKGERGCPEYSQGQA